MAAQRRREEQKAAIDAAVQKAREEEQQRSKAEMDDFFSKAGLKNTITASRSATLRSSATGRSRMTPPSCRRTSRQDG